MGREEVRGLRPSADDMDLLRAIGKGEYLINGFRNRDMQAALYVTEAASPAERRKRSSAVSRKPGMLRGHGIIQKVPRTHRYMVTETGRAISIAVPTTARTSVHQLNQLAKAA